MALRSPTREPSADVRRATLTRTSVRVAAMATLLGAGALVAIALVSSHSAQAQPRGSTIISAATAGGGSSARPKRVWMVFEVNPPSFVLRPLRKFAACVRRQGVPGLPDPKVVNGKVVLMLPPGYTAKSARLKRALRACRKLLPRGANTQPGAGTGPTTTRPGG